MNVSWGFIFLGGGAIPTNAEDRLSELPLPLTFAHDSGQTTTLGGLSDTEVGNDFLTRPSPNSVARHANILLPSQNLLHHYRSDTVQNIIGGQSTHEDHPELQNAAESKRKPKSQNGVMRGGPNRFGRKGTIRCQRCRSWRRKVAPQVFALL